MGDVKTAEKYFKMAEEGCSEENDKIRCRNLMNKWVRDYLDDLVQDWGISSASALEIPQSCTKPPIRFQLQTINYLFLKKKNNFF